MHFVGDHGKAVVAERNMATAIAGHDGSAGCRFLPPIASHSRIFTMGKVISATDFFQRLQAGEPVELIDVRTPAEFQEVHVEIAQNYPLDRLDPQAIQAARPHPEGRPLYVICRSGARGRQACDKFVAAGYPEVINVDGGTMACVAAGVPVVRGKKAIPLDCQVRMLAGSLVAIGTALGHWVHPAWLLLPAAVGLGLVYSGWTNTCMMGNMLAKMPWNQAPTQLPANPSCSRT